MLKNTQEIRSLDSTLSNYKEERAIFFDYLSWFIVIYPHGTAVILHSIPVAAFLFMPFVIYFWDSRTRSCFAIFNDFVKGVLFHAAGVILAIIFPIIFSVVRLFFSSYAMSWFAHPYLAFMMFIPCSLAGLLIPRTVWKSFPLSQDVSIKKSKEALFEESRFWGAFGFYAFLTFGYLVAGLGGGFLMFIVSASMLPAWILFRLSLNADGRISLRSTAFYVIALVPCLTYTVYFGGFLVQFLIEKMGMMGALPPPYGYYIADVVVAVIVGTVTAWCVGPIIPVCGHWLAKSSILKFLLHVSVLSLALASQFFPYSNTAPKRIVFQHTCVTADANRILGSSYDFTVVDSNSLLFLFKHAPEVAKQLHIGSDFSFEAANLSHQGTFLALFPVSHLFARGLQFPARSDDFLKQYRSFPHLSSVKPHTISSDESRRVHLEFSLGDLQEVWVAVLNITGPVTSWSLADNILPASETVDGGPPSYICRLSGSSHENWMFWLEASRSGDIRVEVAVIEQVLVEEAKRVKGLFPDWVDVVSYSSFMSSYIF